MYYEVGGVSVVSARSEYGVENAEWEVGSVFSLCFCAVGNNPDVHTCTALSHFLLGIRFDQSAMGGKL